MGVLANTTRQFVDFFRQILFCSVLGLQLLRHVMMESFHKNGWRPHPDPIEGIGNLTSPMEMVLGSRIGRGAHGQGVIRVKKHNLSRQK